MDVRLKAFRDAGRQCGLVHLDIRALRRELGPDRLDLIPEEIAV